MIAEKREDGASQTEATIKIWVDGERYVRTAEGNGPVHALDRALRDAIGERHPHLRDIRLVNYKVRILEEWKATGATTRVLLDASDGHDTWGAIGVHENVIEASLGRAGGLAGGGHAARPRPPAPPTRRPPRPAPARGHRAEAIPMARPVLGRRRSRPSSRCCAPGQLSLGPRVPRVRGRLRGAHRRGLHASAVSSGTAGLHLALRAAGVGEGDEVITSPFSFVASANVILYERARPVFVDIDPDTLHPRPGRGGGGGHRAHERAAARPHLRLGGRRAGLERLGLPIVEDACEALGAVHADGIAVGARGHAAVFAFYANKQMTTGEGGMRHAATRREPRRASTPSATRAARPTWAGSTTTGSASTTACPTSRARSGSPSSSGSTAARRPPPRRRLVPRGAGRASSGPRAALPDAGGDSRWFVYVVQLPRGVDRDETILALRDRGVESKPYLPAIHLFSFYRERFGHRQASSRSPRTSPRARSRCRSSRQMTEGQVARVAEALRAVLGRRLK